MTRMKDNRRSLIANYHDLSANPYHHRYYT